MILDDCLVNHAQRDPEPCALTVGVLLDCGLATAFTIRFRVDLLYGITRQRPSIANGSPIRRHEAPKPINSRIRLR